MKYLSLFVVFALSGCATLPPPQTPSGRPEITLSNVNAACVRSKTANALVDGGFAIKTMNDYSLIAERKVTSGMAAFLYSTQMSGNPDERVTITFIPNGSAVRMVWNAAYVSNAGTGFEKSTPIPASQNDEQMLLQIKPKIESSCPIQ